MGGALLDDDDEDDLRARYNDLCEKWQITYPLHSSEIRNAAKRFRWLRNTPARRDEFMADLGSLVTAPCLTAIACVIHRPGYDARYRKPHGRGIWLLCKTAFTIVVERAIKHAHQHNGRLRVLVEKSDPETDRMLRGYYDALRKDGHPFNQSTASKYAPLTTDDYKRTLFEFRTKEKSSPLIQLADLMLWPVCIGRYNAENKAYVMLREAGTLIDMRLSEEQREERGIKYSCFESYTPKKPEPGLSTGPGQPPNVG